MSVNIQELAASAGLTEQLYPGKRLIRKYAQAGEHKSHCVVFDWHDAEKLHVEIKAGLTGRALDPKELHHFPVSFQAPTYLDIAFKDTEEDEEEEGTRGKSGSGSGGLSMKSFAQVTEGKV